MSRPFTISKSVFLAARECPTKGWLSKHLLPTRAADLAVAMRQAQGIEVGQLARKQFPAGVLVQSKSLSGDFALTRDLLSDPKSQTIFEAAFQVEPFVAKADILVRVENGWQLIEVKSGTKSKKEYVDDIAYTASLLLRSGLNVTSAALMLLSSEFRLGHPEESRFYQKDVTKDVMRLATEFQAKMDLIAMAIRQEKPPSPTLSLACRTCDFFETDCLGREVENPIFDIPELTKRQCVALLTAGVIQIERVPHQQLKDDRQRIVHKAVTQRKQIVNRPLLGELLSRIVWPAHYLDFETLTWPVPFYLNVTPYEQVPTQYSLHIFDGPGNERAHVEYLADPSCDCREELAHRLLEDLGRDGTIVVYSGFESTIIKKLADQFPALRPRLTELNDRLFDLCHVFRTAIYHPAFHGSASIKATLPVLSNLSYEDLQIQNGTSAIETFLRMAKGYADEAESKQLRQHLLDYCKRDTLAMVELHQIAIQILNVS